MNSVRLATISIALAILANPAPAHSQRGGAPADWSAVDRALGRPGKSQPGEVQKYSLPRSDLHVTVRGIELKPALALGSWVAFKRMGGSNGGAMAMGDLVLTEAEVPDVIAKLQAGGVRQTALHNHLQHESPAVMYLHIEGRGDPVKIAETIRAALATSNTPPAAPPSPQPSAFSLDTAALAGALSHSGSVTGGVYQVSVARADPIRIQGMEIPPAMGVATAINFQPTGSGKAAITGDFVLTADEVNPVIRALERQRIVVTAIHSHMLEEEPRLFFMHFWANDDAVRLAGGLRQALDQTRVKSDAR
jgi:hypothetical protein